MSRKSVLGTTLICVLMIALLGLSVGLSGCQSRDPVVVTPSGVEEAEEEEVVEPIRWPLTGLEAPDEEAILLRPLSVKIENSPGARPQVGLNDADVVYETITEGGITRFNAIYQSEIPDRVLPVRSARSSDAWIVPQWGNGLFFYSGGMPQVSNAMRDAGVTSMSHGALGDTLYDYEPGRPWLHGLFLKLSLTHEVAADMGYDITTAEPISGPEFQSLVFENPSFESVETTATNLVVPFSPGYTMTWDWNQADNRWDRSMNGIEHVDGYTGERVNTTNLIVLWAEYIPTGLHDSAGSPTYNIRLFGEGGASVFMSGQRIDGTWTADDLNAPPVFKDSRGEVIVLTPGRTWISVLPLDIDVEVSYASDYSESEYAADSYGTGSY